jgi:hypothetical protein
MTRFVCAVTPEEARVVWDSMQRPTPGKVVKHFKEVEGKSVGIDTVRKWFSNNWVKKSPGRKYANSIKEIEKQLPLLTGHTIGDVYAKYVKKSGGTLSEEETFELASRDMANFLIGLVASQTRMMEVMSRADPKGFSELVKATTSVAQAVQTMHHQNNAIKRKTVDLVADKSETDDDLNDALASWSVPAPKSP